MNGQHIDLSSEPNPYRKDVGYESASTARRFLGVHFTCCDIYSRVYINKEQTGYHGACPRCGATVRFRIGPGGASGRFFRAE